MMTLEQPDSLECGGNPDLSGATPLWIIAPLFAMEAEDRTDLRENTQTNSLRYLHFKLIKM